MMNVKKFDKKLVKQSGLTDSHITVGQRSEKIGHQLLLSEEGFDLVLEPDIKFRGQPFDRLGRKQGKWYIVEIKGASHDLGSTPGYTQKVRMTKLLSAVKGIQPCLIQINLDTAKYKIRYGEEVLALLKKTERKEQRIDNIVDWVKQTIKE